MTLTLQIDGKEKTFVVDFISTRMLRRTISLTKTLNFEDISPEELDQLAQFLVDLYGKAFTVDDLYDGLPSSQFIPTITESISGVVNGLADATSAAESGEGKNG